MKTPEHFSQFPSNSVLHKWEAERIARNILLILARTGNQFRDLSWDEYKQERLKDGNFTEGEKVYFDQVIGYCTSAEAAAKFSPNWRE